ncbi:MAG: hypothetical protein HY721_12405 [Planctomycetes bacterium]|nr:hypothetical protein [Planctomycetota bacterium]
MPDGRTRGSRPLKAVDALCRLREVEDRQARGRLYTKRTEIARLQREIEHLKARRERAGQRRGPDVLRDRLLLDALVKVSLERRRALEALGLQAAVLLEECREAHARKDAALRLKERRRAEEEIRASRRAESSVADLAAALRAREGRGEEGSCDS